MLSWNSVIAVVSAGAIAAALTGCSAGSDPETGRVGEPIVSGTTVSAGNSPVLFMSGPQGRCTATLVAPNLVVTARHCTAQNPEGQFTCTPSGDLVMTGTSAGQIGVDDPPTSLSFFTNQRVLNGTLFSGPPDAVGLTTLSTNSPTSCRDDLAFIVLRQPLSGITPAALRLDPTTYFGESVSAWGYGLTEDAADTVALRARSNALIEGVGYDMPSTGTQLAPLRAVRVGPDDITCNGDSGGPITSNATGAIIGIASMGAESSMSMPSCAVGGNADTTGPRLGAYESLALLAFRTAGATPTLEPGSTPIVPPEAGLDATPEAATPSEAGSEITPKNEPPGTTIPYRATGGSCSASPGPAGGYAPLGALLVFMASAAARTLRSRARATRPSRCR